MIDVKSPDVRGWAVIGGFAVTMLVLIMIARNPGLLDSAPFMALIGPLISGTLLLVYSNLFGGTKSGTETATKMADTVAAGAPPATDKGDGVAK